MSARPDPSVLAPAGLKAAKSIVTEDNETVLQVFELDYKPRLKQEAATIGPPAPPGIVASTRYLIVGLLMLIRASPRQTAKTGVAKFQLYFGYLGAGALALSWIVALVAALAAAGVPVPSRLDRVFGEEPAKYTFGITGVTATITWAAVRRHGLAFAAMLRHLIDYVRNVERTRLNVTLTLDDALDGLRDAGWTGPVHLLGYSFGSLVMFDAVFPRRNDMKDPAPIELVTSLVTVGCPLDLVRLYAPKYADDRLSRKPGLPWRNIYIAADLFGSNIRNREDVEETAGESPTTLAHLNPTSHKFLDEELTPTRVLLARGFRVHSGYWGEAAGGHCLETIADDWLVVDVTDSAAGQPSAPEPEATSETTDEHTE